MLVVTQCISSLTKDEPLEFAYNLLEAQAGALSALVWKTEGPNGFVIERPALEWEYGRRTKP